MVKRSCQPCILLPFQTHAYANATLAMFSDQIVGMTPQLSERRRNGSDDYPKARARLKASEHSPATKVAVRGEFALLGPDAAHPCGGAVQELQSGNLKHM